MPDDEPSKTMMLWVARDFDKLADAAAAEAFPADDRQHPQTPNQPACRPSAVSHTWDGP
jgi:hypothetical protein